MLPTEISFLPAHAQAQASAHSAPSFGLDWSLAGRQAREVKSGAPPPRSSTAATGHLEA
ncbi:uncharacterized protein H6S33_000185 [Morchella sextelata]|uniref:uncharacterized protein n=1 Tax=Morchella sextelata TaxID=1174677 RepID=UPI001D05858D|nr:uncharacterized protein H6S33_000185 [Morchella sextelata]KAH0614549.1 hypothetical protein H6S33_000185 [Morchella sextelata]